MNDFVMSNSPVSATKHSFLVALIAAIMAHIVLVLGVQLDKPEPQQISRSIDITLVNEPSLQAPEKTPLLAEENQLGSSEQTEPVKQPEPPAPQTVPISQVNPIPENLTEKIQPAPKVKPVLKTPEKIKPLPEPKPVEPPPEPKPIEKPIPKEQPFKADPSPVKPDIEQKVLTQNSEQTRTRWTINAGKPRLSHHISAIALQQQIAEQATVSTRQAVEAPPPPQIKTKSVNQVSANKYVAAQYLHDWEAKVTNIGNRNYPEAATKAGFSATLIMEVEINSEGEIENMRITQSSGNPELDEAAKKIVRMSAPFPPLPLALRNELDILKITRVWKFTDESGLVTQ
jgi:protein TonB